MTDTKRYIRHLRNKEYYIISHLFPARRYHHILRWVMMRMSSETISVGYRWNFIGNVETTTYAGSWVPDKKYKPVARRHPHRSRSLEYEPIETVHLMLLKVILLRTFLKTCKEPETRIFESLRSRTHRSLKVEFFKIFSRTHRTLNVFFKNKFIEN